VQRYILRRLLWNVPVLLIVSLMVFSLVRLLPGDAVIAQIGEARNLTPEDIDRIRAELGLDRPFLTQYVTWLTHAVRGDLGDSFWLKGKAVTQNIAGALGYTAELAVLGLFVALCLALPIGILSAARRNTVIDYLGRGFAISGLSIPEFFLGTLVLIYLSREFRWIPFDPPRLTEDPVQNLKEMAIPAVLLGINLSASTMRMTRSTMLEVLREDYIRTAWAKGLKERTIVVRHALKNAMIPVLTIVGTQFARLMGGTVIIETLFSIRGMGKLFVDAIAQRDYPQIQGNIMFVALVILTMNLIVDLLYGWLDPRIRYT
jgi:peptide/nickel transport system permease protein